MDAASTSWVASDPVRALQWKSDNVSALDNLGRQIVLQAANEAPAEGGIVIKYKTPIGELDFVRQVSGQAIRAEPLDLDALTNLALVERLKGSPSRAFAIANVVVQWTGRDLIAQRLAFEDDLNKSNYANALTRADLMLRVTQRAGGALYPLLERMVLGRTSGEPLIRFLTGNPPWKTDFLVYLVSSGKNLDAVAAVFDAILNSGGKIEASELKSLLQRLIDSRRFDEAFALRQRVLPVSKSSRNLLVNGTFSTAPSGLPFDWILNNTLDAEARIQPVSASSFGLLKVEFSGARVNDTQIASEILLLKPGRYSFKVESAASDFSAARGVWWQIACIGKPEPMSHTELVSKTSGWRELELQFTVPESECKAQSIELVVPSRIELERRVEGELQFRNARLIPLS